MRSQQTIDGYNGFLGAQLARFGSGLPRKALIGVILTVALLAFEIFNFDTTRYALRNLMGEITFLGFQWAAILALAFCSIDFAGLVRLFTPERGRDEPKEVWYLMGAWLLGATMNALMTWWAVSLTLLNNDFGNEVLSRGQLLTIVPVFVAVLVWLTRILFIGAFTVAGEHILDLRNDRPARQSQLPTTRTVKARPISDTANRRRRTDRQGIARPVENTGASSRVSQPTAKEEQGSEVRKPSRTTANRQPMRPRGSSRIRQRPPMPKGVRRTPFNGVQASPRRRS